ncbi:MAG: heme-binding protein [Verrucomicrobiae bacterium]|nr:heme-binding protein [Verrucomicrobiae bacterium]
MSRMSLCGLGILVGVGVVAFVATSRAGYETARYETLVADGPFELRRYESLQVVTTSIDDEGQGSGFGRLFRYISGRNTTEQKIDMTTPVFMPGGSGGKAEEMQFVIPERVASSGAPGPVDENVRLGRMEGGIYAVLRFKGKAIAEQRRDRLDELRAILAGKGLEAEGEPIYAGYDPPWTPGLLRRNEVLLRVKR